MCSKEKRYISLYNYTHICIFMQNIHSEMSQISGYRAHNSLWYGYRHYYDRYENFAIHCKDVRIPTIIDAQRERLSDVNAKRTVTVTSAPVTIRNHKHFNGTINTRIMLMLIVIVSLSFELNVSKLAPKTTLILLRNRLITTAPGTITYIHTFTHSGVITTTFFFFLYFTRNAARQWNPVSVIWHSIIRRPLLDHYNHPAFVFWQNGCYRQPE